ncbi:MAG TPA: ABC transporter substrate-binding protein [Actinomycetota bacterium]|nr:ABC transporter substrate-binding protein [Actinomycetota bacterium]
MAVVASVTGPTSVTDATYLDGMRLAEAEVNGAGVGGERPLRLEAVDDRGDTALGGTLLEAALEDRPVATFVIGPGSVVSPRRSLIEEVGSPLLLLSGDLYTSRELFRQTFQTGVPWRWQAAVIMRYLTVDRRHTRVLAVTEAGPQERSVREAIEASSLEEGTNLSTTLTLVPGGELAAILRHAAEAEAVAFFGSAAETARLSEALGALPDRPQLAASSEALSPDFSAAAPGTVATYPYTWAGWADPIPRVGEFRARFEEALGRQPAGFEQEGYDAVRLVADGLARSGGEGGDALVRALQGFRERVYSSLPVRFGPDDRTAIDDGQLGLFAVPAPDEAPEPWFTEAPRWRPLMRTFTFDGEKTNVLDRDKRVFFPRWRKPRPSPKYWRSRYGITSRPRQDSLH